MYELSIIQWLLAFFAAFLVGLSKSGIKGINTLTVTILLVTFGGKASTGILLPMLIMGDIMAVIYYKKHAQWQYIYKLLPWMLIGVLLGVWIGEDMPENVFRKAMAIIILGTVVMLFWWERKPVKTVPDQWWFAGIMGLGAGFTTMIGNLAGVFSNIFFLAMRLPKNAFIGTAAWLFFIINLFKLPFHIFVWGTITTASFTLNIKLLVGLLIGFYFGTRFIKIIKEQQFRHLILILTAIGALAILWRS